MRTATGSATSAARRGHHRAGRADRLTGPVRRRPPTNQSDLTRVPQADPLTGHAPFPLSERCGRHQPARAGSRKGRRAGVSVTRLSLLQIAQSGSGTNGARLSTLVQSTRSAGRLLRRCGVGSIALDLGSLFSGFLLRVGDRLATWAGCPRVTPATGRRADLVLENQRRRALAGIEVRVLDVEPVCMRRGRSATLEPSRACRCPARTSPPSARAGTGAPRLRAARASRARSLQIQRRVVRL
jgi:hypothetical protein